MEKENTLSKGLIVSCQAGENEPFYSLNIMRYMAKAAVEGGAIAIRALADEVPQIKGEVNVPIIGLMKRHYADSEVYITPTKEEVDLILASGANVIALDATARKRPGGETLAELVNYIRKAAPDIALMADIDTYENAINAEQLGFEFISTTLCGHTDETRDKAVPDYPLIKKLKRSLTTSKLIVEGGIWEVGQMKRVLKYDPYAVVVGTAITRPHDITKRFKSLF